MDKVIRSYTFVYICDHIYSYIWSHTFIYIYNHIHRPLQTLEGLRGSLKWLWNGATTPDRQKGHGTVQYDLILILFLLLFFFTLLGKEFRPQAPRPWVCLAMLYHWAEAPVWRLSPEKNKILRLAWWQFSGERHLLCTLIVWMGKTNFYRLSSDWHMYATVHTYLPERRINKGNKKFLRQSTV